MDQMEEKLGALLNNPQIMQQVMSMAQTLGQSAGQEKQEASKQQEPKLPAMPDIDISMLQKLSGIAGQSGIDREQKALLSALEPYLSRSRVDKLERAMRAAKMARMASAFMGQGGIRLLTGR